MLQTPLKYLAVILCLFISTVPAQANGFSTPSGNILCYWDPMPSGDYENTPLTCLVFEADWGEPSGLQDCGLDETRALTLPRNGSAQFEWYCHGDVFWPLPLGALDYGSKWTLRGFECEVETNGVRCTNRSGNGFHVRRAAYSMF